MCVYTHIPSKQVAYTSTRIAAHTCIRVHTSVYVYINLCIFVHVWNITRQTAYVAERIAGVADEYFVASAVHLLVCLCIAGCCSVLQNVSCSVLKCVAVCCSVPSGMWMCVAVFAYASTRPWKCEVFVTTSQLMPGKLQQQPKKNRKIAYRGAGVAVVYISVQLGVTRSSWQFL